MSKNRLKLLALYWFIAYVFWLPVYAGSKLGYIDELNFSYGQILTLNISYLLTLLATAMVILHILDHGESMERFGLKSGNLKTSLMYSGLALIPSFIISLAILVFIINGSIDPNTFLQGNLPAFIEKEFSRELVPLAGLLHWFISGFTSFMLLQAFPIELSYGKLKTIKVFLVNLMLWSGLYNGLFYSLLFNLPLNVSIMGEAVDIIVLGFFFMATYMKTRNCLWLIIGYVLVYEAPVKACIYYGWGTNALIAILIIGVAWSIYGIIELIDAKKIFRQ